MIIINIFVVTYCPIYAEYGNQISLRKAFVNEIDAKKYIEEEKTKEIKLSGDANFIGDFDIEELELLTDF